jgi:hypothetical protein
VDVLPLRSTPQRGRRVIEISVCKDESGSLESGPSTGAVLLSAFVLSTTVTFGKWYLAEDDRLGVLHFPISCGWESQREFTNATSLLHLFQFADAGYVYSDLVKRDSDCAMGYWGGHRHEQAAESTLSVAERR